MRSPLGVPQAFRGWRPKSSCRLPAVAKKARFPSDCHPFRPIRRNPRKVSFMPDSMGFPGLSKWYPHPELNRDQRFRKPPLYPFELWGRPEGMLRLEPEPARLSSACARASESRHPIEVRTWCADRRICFSPPPMVYCTVAGPRNRALRAKMIG